MTKFSDIFTNTLALSVFRMVAKFFSAILTFYLARKLGVEQYGVYGSILALLGIVGVFQGFGCMLVLFRDTSRNPLSARVNFAVALAIYIVSSAVLSIVILIVGHFLKYDSERMGLLVIASLTYLSFAPAIASQTILMGIGQFIRQAFISSFGVVVNLILCISFLEMGFSLLGIFWSLTISYGLVSVCLFLKTVQLIGYPDFSGLLPKIKNVMAEGFPLLLSSVVAEIMYRADRTLIDHFIGPLTVGYYQAAFNVFYLPREGFLIPFGSAISKNIFDKHENDKESFFVLFEHANIALLFFSLPLIIYTIFFSGQVIGFLYGADFAPAGQILSILIGAVPIVFLITIWQPVLLSKNKSTFLFLCNGLAMVIYLISNYFFIPLWGVKASAAVLVMSQAVVLGMIMMAAGQKSYFRFLWRAKKLLLVNIALIFFIVACKSVFEVDFFGAAVICSIATFFYVGLMFLTNTITAEERLWLKTQISELYRLVLSRIMP